MDAQSGERSKATRMQIIRHGEALHNIEHNNALRDPPLTLRGHNTTQKLVLATRPDILLISPMTRTIQTALNMFPSVQEGNAFPIPVEIWPDLREAHDAECNKVLPRAELSKEFPYLDFSSCSEEGDYPPHTIEAATVRAERVRERLKGLSASYTNIAIITHRGFIAFLVKGRRFDTSETRSYRFATDEEARNPTKRIGVNCDTLLEQDFGPTLLFLERGAQDGIITSLS